MDDTLLFLLFFVALALGWTLGRLNARRAQREQVPEYFKGISYILNDRPDKAVDALVSTLELDSDSFGAHLMLAGLFRQRGELERATRIHHRLLARTTLTFPEKKVVQLELAKDYLAAGLQDRGIVLIDELIGTTGDHQVAALRVGLRFALRHKRLERAKEFSELLIKKGQEAYKVELSHIYCELAEVSINNAQFKQAQRQLKQAAKVKLNPRVLLLQSQLAFKEGAPWDALALIRQNYQLYPNYITINLQFLHTLCEHLGQDYDAYLAGADASIVDVQLARLERFVSQGEDEKVLSLLSTEPPPLDQLWVLLKVVKCLVQLNPSIQPKAWALLECELSKAEQICRSWQCHNCGWLSQQLSWHCPNCDSWGTIGRDDGALHRAKRDSVASSSFRWDK